MTAPRDDVDPAPDSTAVRVALWRAMHLEVDSPPHVLEDTIGLQLVAPPEGWRSRPDMDAHATAAFRAWIVARARFAEDLVAAEADNGVAQYVLLGAGLDTFAQRRPDGAARIEVFEVDRPGPQAWKRRRLIELGFDIPQWLHFVPVDLEANDDWSVRLAEAGFDRGVPALVASVGVSMYLTKDANRDTVERISAFSPGSVLAMTFQLRLEFVEAGDRSGRQAAVHGARASGTPFVSFYSPDEILSLATHAGFRNVRHVPGSSLSARYFSDRADGLRPSSGEDFLVART